MKLSLWPSPSNWGLLALVVSGLPVVEFVDLGQVICDIIGSRVYSAGQARGEVFQPPGDTNYLHINKQTMKMRKKNYMTEGFSSTIFYTLVPIIFFIVYFVHW